jgi:hypothetical protein
MGKTYISVGAMRPTLPMQPGDVAPQEIKGPPYPRPDNHGQDFIIPLSSFSCLLAQPNHQNSRAVGKMRKSDNINA